MEYPLYIDSKLVGAVAAIEQNGRILVTARAPYLRDGVYKAYLKGSERLGIGVMAPQGEEMCAARAFWPAQIKKLGENVICEAEMSLRFGAPQPEQKDETDTLWRAEPQPQRLFSDDLLASRWSHIKNALIKKENSYTLLAVPFEENKPFALLPMFCLASPMTIGGKKSLVFRINSAGFPVSAG